jgi:uncharacterized protein (UPF0333 family)
MFRKKGQSILEYVIVLTAIIAAVIIGSQYIKTKVDQGLKDASTAIGTASTKLGGVSP